MVKYNWKIMKKHRMNYDGSCNYCGKKYFTNEISPECVCAAAMRQMCLDEIKTLKYKKNNARRLNYLRKNINECYNFYFKT
jgi:hypothetical protein